MKYIPSTLAGLFATFVAGLILFPAVYLIFDNFFEMNWGTSTPESRINNIIVLISCGLWFFIASIAGGAFCVQHIEGKEDFAIFLLIISSFFIAWLKFGNEILTTDAIPAYAIFIAGYMLGGWYGSRRKKKKSAVKKKKE